MSCARVEDIDWGQWKPTDVATLVFVIHANRVLLIRKKRGLGAGKINGPGGRVEPGERPVDGARRELREEVGVAAGLLTWAGEHRFQFVDGYGIDVHVYRADHIDGTPIETEEAVPMWIAIEAIPYGEMWEDDRLWLPLVIARTRFAGYWVFDGDRMLDHRLAILPSGCPDRQGAAEASITRDRAAWPSR